MKNLYTLAIVCLLGYVSAADLNAIQQQKQVDETQFIEINDSDSDADSIQDSDSESDDESDEAMSDDENDQEMDDSDSQNVQLKFIENGKNWFAAGDQSLMQNGE